VGGAAVDQAPAAADRELQRAREMLARARHLPALRRQRHGQHAALLHGRRPDELDAAAAQAPGALPHLGAHAVENRLGAAQGAPPQSRTASAVASGRTGPRRSTPPANAAQISGSASKPWACPHHQSGGKPWPQFFSP
jgi:hypothetical protein